MCAPLGAGAFFRFAGIDAGDSRDGGPSRQSGASARGASPDTNTTEKAFHAETRTAPTQQDDHENSESHRKPADDVQVIDRLSKQCRHVADEYGLSARETEVMELLGRGRSGPAIASELFISENTVRTHIKRIYAKVGVSKKQELLAVLEHTSPA